MCFLKNNQNLSCHYDTVFHDLITLNILGEKYIYIFFTESEIVKYYKTIQN